MWHRHNTVPFLKCWEKSIRYETLSFCMYLAMHSDVQYFLDLLEALYRDVRVFIVLKERHARDVLQIRGWKLFHLKVLDVL